MTEFCVIIEQNKIVARFQFKDGEAYYAWEAVRAFVKTLGKRSFTIIVTYSDEN